MTDTQISAIIIPEEKRVAVTRALKDTFGVETFDEISCPDGGMSSAFVSRIVVKGTPYLLRVITRTDPMTDPTRQFAAMRAAAEAGIAPKVHYTNIEDRVMITDFVEPVPYPDDFALRIAPALRTLHALPNFPKSIVYPDVMDKIVRQVQSANMLPESVIGEAFRAYDDILRIYPRDESEFVACHNDLKPQNTLFDGERIWLVDWEAAFLNDPYCDLAVTANFFIGDEAQEDAFLNAYFGEPATEYQRARFFLMTQIMHMFYIGMFMMLVGKSGIPIDPGMTVPGFREFHQQLISGEADSGVPETQLVYAKVHLNAMLTAIQSPRFEESLALIGKAHSGA